MHACVSRWSWWVSVWSVCLNWREACQPSWSWCNRKEDGRVSQSYRFECRWGEWALFRSCRQLYLSFFSDTHTHNTHTHTHTTHTQICTRACTHICTNTCACMHTGTQTYSHTGQSMLKWALGNKNLHEKKPKYFGIFSEGWSPFNISVNRSSLSGSDYWSKLLWCSTRVLFSMVDLPRRRVLLKIVPAYEGYHFSIVATLRRWFSYLMNGKTLNFPSLNF